MVIFDKKDTKRLSEKWTMNVKILMISMCFILIAAPITAYADDIEIEKKYYDGGQVKSEVSKLGRQRHGLTQTFYKNERHKTSRVFCVFLPYFMCHISRK